MSELINLQALVLVQQEELAQLRREVDVLRKRLRTRQDYYCDNHCNSRESVFDGQNCQFCDKLLCGFCEICCDICDFVACSECSFNKIEKYSCNECHLRHRKCKDCSSKPENMNLGHLYENCKGQLSLVTN